MEKKWTFKKILLWFFLIIIIVVIGFVSFIEIRGIPKYTPPGVVLKLERTLVIAG